MLADLISELVSSFLYCYVNLFSDVARHLILRVRHWFHAAAAAAANGADKEEKENGADKEEEEEKEEECCEGDVQLVMERLGMLDGWCCNRFNGVVEAMLEEKRASEEELRDAFDVFDRNQDGFISPGELWCVMRRLGLQEGLRLEACERMIGTFDEDGDGKIDFHEFTRLLENAF